MEETMQMLQFRESIKSQMSPEEWETTMAFHKGSIQGILEQVPGINSVLAAEFIVDRLDADKALDDDSREMWKALVVVAAFEMAEF